MPCPSHPHDWLDPENGKLWLGMIAEQLTLLDPEYVEVYKCNAIEVRLEISSAIEEVRRQLGELDEHNFIVFHDVTKPIFARPLELSIVSLKL